MKPQHALIDFSTRAFLTVSSQLPVILELRKFVPNCVWRPDIDANHAQGTNLHTLPGERLVEYRLHERVIEKLEERLLTTELRERGRLVCAQRDAIAYVMLGLSYISARVGTGVQYQNLIYAQKLKEAEAMLSVAGHDSGDLRWFPYVLQHAEHHGMTPEKAAHDIIFESKLMHETLVRVEGMRLTYYDRIARAQTPAEALAARDDFRTQVGSNALQ